jgi:hypothetical protein
MKEITYRTVADYFLIAFAFGIGICPIDVIIRWADHLVQQTQQPDQWMLALSGTYTKDRVDIARILDSIPGNSDFRISIHLLLARLRQVKPSITKDDLGLVQQMFQLTHDKRTPREICELIYKLDTDVDYAAEGYKDWGVIDLDYREILELGNPHQQTIEELHNQRV